MAKARLEDMDDMLTEVGKTMLNRYPSLIRLRVIFLPQIGFLIALDRESSQNVPEGFEFFFSEESDSFFKTMRIIAQYLSTFGKVKTCDWWAFSCLVEGVAAHLGDDGLV